MKRVVRKLICRKCGASTTDNKSWGNTPCPRCGWPMDVMEREEIDD